MADVALQPRQLAATAAVYECDRPDGPTEVGYGGARGGGKSHWALAIVGCDLCQREPGLKWLVLRKVGKAARESFEDLRIRLFRRLPHEYNRQEGVLRFANGSRIHLGHFKDEKDVDAYLGLEYDGVIVEEATTLGHAKVQAIRSCVRTSKPNWRPRLIHTTNPGGIGHAWFKEQFVTPAREGVSDRTRFVPATARDNAFLNPEYIRTLEGLTGWLRRAWLDGDWDIAAGQFFTTFSRPHHVVEPFPIPESWRVWLGFDYGWTHYTSCHLFAQSDDGHVYVVAEHGERGWLAERHGAAIHAMLARHGVGVHRLMGVFAGADVFAKKLSGGTVADDYARLGQHRLALRPANMDRINGAAEILRRMGDPLNGIAPTLSIFSTCRRLAESLPSLEHDPHRAEDVLKVDTDDDGRGGDDFYDSFRYGVMAAANRRALNVTEVG